MGARFSCMLSKDKRPSRKNPSRAPKLKKGGSCSSTRTAKLEEELLQLYQQHMRLERSSSMRYPTQASKQGLSRSSSARSRQSTDPFVQPLQLLNKEAALEAETRQIVLVHGGGFGAWCWYKLWASLEEAGFQAHAIDLAGAGIDSSNPNQISTIELYVKPMLDYMEKISENEKVMLVGHDFGGPCISYVMEKCPQKIAKSVFLCATMMGDGQSAFDVFSPEVVTENDLLQKSQVFVYGNGNTGAPTAVEFKRDALKELLFNQSPAKDVALATLSIRPMPFAPILEKICLTPEKYGTVPRYYIETTEDHALTTAVQQNMVKLNPPHQVFRLKGSDHSPFFSKPQGLLKLLLEIAQIRSKAA